MLFFCLIDTAANGLYSNLCDMYWHIRISCHNFVIVNICHSMESGNAGRQYGEIVDRSRHLENCTRQQRLCELCTISPTAGNVDSAVLIPDCIWICFHWDMLYLLFLLNITWLNFRLTPSDPNTGMEWNTPTYLLLRGLLEMLFHKYIFVLPCSLKCNVCIPHVLIWCWAPSVWPQLNYGCFHCAKRCLKHVDIWV